MKAPATAGKLRRGGEGEVALHGRGVGWHTFWVICLLIAMEMVVHGFGFRWARRRYHKGIGAHSEQSIGVS